MTRFTLQRKYATETSTIGYLSLQDTAVWTLEDPKRLHKVYGDTQIPAGVYNLALRTEGGMHQRYSARFPKFHKGMIWIKDVPQFEWVYIHIGNRPADTEGCILVGLGRLEDFIYKSTAAYQRIYPRIVESIAQESCVLDIRDIGDDSSDKDQY